MSKEDNKMRKHLKSIAAAFMVGVMLMSISTFAMAAEQVPVVGEAEVLLQETETTVEMAGTERAVYSNHYSGSYVYLKAGTVLTTELEIYEDRNTAVHVLSGKSAGTYGQAVVFRFTNNETGASRSFTALADNGTLDDKYNSYITGGKYTLTVVYVGTPGYYDVDIWFANT